MEQEYSTREVASIMASLYESPDKYNFKTNMTNIKDYKPSMFSFFDSISRERNYWASLSR